MKVVVIGGTGLIGSRLVTKLCADGHDTFAASPATGVDIISGKGLAEALAGAEVVVDVANAPDWGDAAVMDFFQTSARNILAAETAAAVGHHVALSVVGTDRLQASGYFRAKLAQEQTLKAGAIPSTILRATQFFEFIGAIADAGTQDGVVRVPPVLFQPDAAVTSPPPWPISPRTPLSTAPSNWAAPNGSGSMSSSGASCARRMIRGRS